MGKTGWQTVALFAIAWAVAASAIAWVNKGQIEQQTTTRRAGVAAVEEPEEPPYSEAEIDELERPKTFHPIRSNERCLGGVVLRKVGNGWESVTWPNGEAVKCPNT